MIVACHFGQGIVVDFVGKCGVSCPQLSTYNFAYVSKVLFRLCKFLTFILMFVCLQFDFFVMIWMLILIMIGWVSRPWNLLSISGISDI